ncbi:MAG: HD-GYP domain-containing protein [Thermodesulfobacteriota bacterium]
MKKQIRTKGKSPFDPHFKPPEKKLGRSSGTAREIKGKKPEDLLHELQRDKIKLERQKKKLCQLRLDLKKSRQRYADLFKGLGGIVQTLTASVESRDPFLSEHQKRVADLARAMAGEMGMTEEQEETLTLAGIIHDLGKVAIPAEVLRKPAGLTETEYELVQKHPQTGYEMLKGIEFPGAVAEVVCQHHERMDGSGYPQGLKGEEISLEAQVLMVADVVEAMCSPRSYRPALGVEAALEEIEKNKGGLYDPEATEVCLKLFREKGFSFE